MPLPISIAHALMRQSAEIRRKHPTLGLRPDAKSQVSVEYDANSRPTRIDTVVISQQHAPTLSREGIEEIVRTRIIEPVLVAYDQYIKGKITTTSTRPANSRSAVPRATPA